MNRNSATREGGFTLIEIVLVVSLIGLMATGGFALQRFLASNSNIRSAGQMVTAALREAQARSVAMIDDDAWAVHVASASVTIFRGTSYSDRDASVDRIADFSVPLQVVGEPDIVFLKGAAQPAQTASLALRFDEDGFHIRVNEEGMIDYGPY